MANSEPNADTIDATRLSRQAEALVCAGVRGEQPPWPKWPDAAALSDVVLERCAFHGTAPLLYHHLQNATEWPQATLERLRNQAAASAIWETHHERLLSSLLAELTARDIAPVLLKGTALAYTSYADPALRARSDTDLLVPPARREEADRVLVALGFQRVTQMSGDLVSHQASYRAVDQVGFEHVIDLHWRISNSEVLGALFCHTEIRDRSVSVPMLGPTARATGPVDAVLIACMHRRSHSWSPYWVDGVAHLSPDRLIWLYDLHLLAERLTSEEQILLLRLAREKGLAGLCHDGLAHAADLLGTQVPSGLLAALDPGDRRETPRVYVDAGAIRQEYMDFRAIAGFGRKLRFLRELVFPPIDYMRSRFAGVWPGWLPWLYLRRGLKGATGRLLTRREGRAGDPRA